MKPNNFGPLTRAIQHYIETGNPSFANSIIFNNCKDNFELVSSSNSSVNLSQVVGMYHANYAGSTWIELIGSPVGTNAKLGRLDSCLRELENNPSYYESDSTKEQWSFSLIDGHLYCDEGHHRTVIGRFYLQAHKKPTLVHGVRLSVYRCKQQTALQSALSKLRDFFFCDK